MTRLSVNVNKIATLRNARGGQVPDLLKAVKDIERFGAQGITVHPRPDERHITYRDVRDLSKIVTLEFNVEGNPREQKFVDLVLEVKPAQVTLVPDAVSQITSDHGWDTVKYRDYLKETIGVFHKAGIRVSIFVDPDQKMIEGATGTGTDRVELYTETYARDFAGDPKSAVAPFVSAAKRAHELKLGVNAGHDLSLENLRYFKQQVPHLLEVSIGHALISDALWYGLENTVQMYLRQLK